jgi:hypothetical protein
LATDGWSAVGWPVPGGAVGVVADGYFPAAFVDFVVVVKAEQIEMFGFGFAVVSEPLFAVVTFGPGGWPVTAGPGAAAVAGYQEMAQAGGDGAGAAAEVEDFGVGAEHCRDDPGVACHPAGRSGREALPVRGTGGAEAVEQCLVTEGR